VNFWSKHFVNDQGLDGYDPVKVTAARPFEEREPGAMMSIKAEGKARLMLEPEYGEAKPITNVLAFQNKKPDPLASIVSSFKPKLPASPNAEIITTPVRYHLDTDLFKALSLVRCKGTRRN
jgi:hypothetical protein